MQKICLILLAVLAGCSPSSFLSSSVATMSTGSQERGFGGYISDGEIRTRLNLILFKRDYEMYQQIDIHVYEGRVLLTGNVPTQKIKEDGVKLVWQIPGVKSVMDETVVAPMRTFSQYIKDKWITTRIDTALLFDQTIKSRNYDVHTQNCVVYITGLAQSDGELKRVLAKAQSVKGVLRVVGYVRTINPLELRRNELAKKSWTRTNGNSPDKVRYREKIQYQREDPQRNPETPPAAKPEPETAQTESIAPVKTN